MSRKRIKQYLMLLLAIGVIAVVANGSGTFASFNAETTNANNTFATGTLFLHNTKGATTCTSESGTGNVQTTGCATLFSVTNLNSNTPSTADLTLTNAGSLDSQNISFKAGGTPCTDSTAAIGALALAATDASSTIKINSLTQTVVAGSKIKLTDGTDNAVFTVTSTTNAATAASTGIPVTNVSATTPGHSFATGTTTVTFSVGFTQTANLCSQLTIYIDVMDSGFTTSSGCVYGTASGGPGTPCTSGLPLSSLPSTLTNLLNISTPQLAAGASQYLRITVVPSLSITNAQQSTQASFDLTWHIAA